MIKKHTRVPSAELKKLLRSLKCIDQREIQTTKEKTKEFYLHWLNLVERLIKFSDCDELGFIVDPLKIILANGGSVISVTKVFDNSELSKSLFFAKLEEILDQLIIDEHQDSLIEQENEIYRNIEQFS